MEAHRPGGEQDPAHQKGEPQQQRCNQVSEHDAPEQRRPIEDEECAEAPQREDCDMGQAERQAHADHPQTLVRGRHRVGDDPPAGRCRGPPDDPLGSSPKAEKAQHKKDNIEGGSALELLRQQIGAPPGLVGQTGPRRRHGSQMHPHRLNPRRQKLGVYVLRLLRRMLGRHIAWRCYLLLLGHPRPGGRILQQSEEFLDLGRRNGGSWSSLGIGQAAPRL
ncbi:MAG: hypothetical protein K0S42_1707, partial [Microvirga sp.]|nr:hypothetical protein [Microvirga sp.]